MPSTRPTGARPTRAVRAPTAAELTTAREIVAAHLRPTPVVPARLPGVEGEVILKLETLQPTGSFKVRGALAALSAYAAAGRANGTAVPVVAASAGNHGLGVAYAAARLGVAATVVVPATASAAKVAALRRFDIELVQHGDDYEAAERHALELAETGVVFVSPYNDAHVIAGQSTLAAEVAQQVGEDVTLVVPVGGGGLVAGSCLTAPNRTRVVGVEAAASPSVSAAVAAGRVVPVAIGETLADGLGGNLEPGSVTPSVAAGRVHSFVQVDEDRIVDAIRVLATQCGLVVEAAAAVGVAALMAGAVPVARQPVVVLTGRHIAPALLTKLLAKAS